MRIMVEHRHYGCDTGCCGHIITVDGVERGGFYWHHPWGYEDHRKWAEKLVAEELGPEHVTDLDWENSWVVDD